MTADDPFDLTMTDEQQQAARRRLAEAAERSRHVWPIRTPRGLDAVIAALPPTMSHSSRVALLNASQSGLDDHSAIEWLAEDGAAFEVIAVLAKEGAPYRTAALVDQLVTLLGSELVAYIASQRDTTAVHWWREGTTEPAFDVTERLAAAFHAAFILRGSLTDGAIHSWMQRRNPRTEHVAPARLLRDGPLASVFTVLAAARQVALRPELHAPVTLEDVIARARQVWGGRSAIDWIYSSNHTYLAGARPIDLIHRGRGREVLDALDGVDQGGMG